MIFLYWGYFQLFWHSMLFWNLCCLEQIGTCIVMNLQETNLISCQIHSLNLVLLILKLILLFLLPILVFVHPFPKHQFLICFHWSNFLHRVVFLGTNPRYILCHRPIYIIRGRETCLVQIVRHIQLRQAKIVYLGLPSYCLSIIRYIVCHLSTDMFHILQLFLY